MTREKFKVYEGVFDEHTLSTLENLKRRNYFDELGKAIKTGKEGDVYHAFRKEKHLAIKIFRITNANFNKISQYITRDFRFKNIRGNKRKVILMWSQKEFRNLQILHKSNVNVPYAYKQLQNAIIMDYIDGTMLKDANIEDPVELYEQVKEQLYIMLHSSRLIHADLSEYNLMLSSDGIIYIIDVGQAMRFKSELDFYEYEDLFTRDVESISRFFNKKFNLGIDSQLLCQELKQGLFENQ
jgi:RIO kinase 1